MNLFSTGHRVLAADFANLINSFKSIQSPVTTPASTSGSTTAFISDITQDAEGKITMTKKTVNFSGYQTVAGMSAYQTVAGMSAYQTVAGMSDYQAKDLQVVSGVTAAAGGSETIQHNKRHFPTVRLMDANTGEEIEQRLFGVTHVDDTEIKISLDASLTGSYKYILD